MVRSPIRRRSSCRVSTETFSTDLVLRTPYRGIETGRPLLRIRVEITAVTQPSSAVVIDSRWSSATGRAAATGGSCWALARSTRCSSPSVNRAMAS